MFFNPRRKLEMPAPGRALKGRAQAMPVENRHHVNGNPIKPPFPDGMAVLIVGMGCFWGAERVFWQAPGVYTTAAGYAAGETPNPTYEEVCSGMTGHNEVVLVVYDPVTIPTEEVLKLFWENHDPTQGMRQGNDMGTQYRSGLYCTTPAQKALAESTKAIVPGAGSAPPATGRSRPRSWTLPISSMPKTITSSIWQRTRPAIAASAAPACSARPASL